MGDTKENMKSSKTDLTIEKKKDGIFGRFAKKRESKKEAPMTFADMVGKADETLDTLLEGKIRDLENEKDDVNYNTKAVALLETMRFHLDSLIDNAGAYGDLRD